MSSSVDVPLVILGATASGKSALALEVARLAGDVEIVSVDSMQVYRGMDIGTAKPSSGEQAEICHHLLDLCDPEEEFSVALYQSAARAALASIRARGKRAVLVGGTGLYLRAIVDELEMPAQYPEARASIEGTPDTNALYQRLLELDPIAAARIEPSNRRRLVRALEVTIGSGRPFSSYGPGLTAYPAVPFHLVGIQRDRADLDRRIALRYEQQMGQGFLQEVARLAERREGLSVTAGYALGYRELIEVVRGVRSLPEALEQARTRTRRFARRQQRWFRRDSRIRWRAATDNSVADAATLLADWSKWGGDTWSAEQCG